jgi:hypothetical protein
MSAHVLRPQVLPARNTAKARLLATLADISQRLELLPEPVCVVLEQSKILQTMRNHVGTAGEVSGFAAPMGEAIATLARVANQMSTSLNATLPRRRR